MPKISYKTLRQQVTQAIRMQILTGGYKPGERIIEQELADHLGVSRGPVREALRQIEEEGLIEYTSHVGCSVKEITDQDIFEIYLLRANFEILSVSLCDGLISDTTIEKMENILLQMHEISGENAYDDTIANDNAFHACIIKECGLERLHKLWKTLDVGNSFIFYSGFEKLDYVISNQNAIHEVIINALKTRDNEIIANAIQEHYMSTVRWRLKNKGLVLGDFIRSKAFANSDCNLCL